MYTIKREIGRLENFSIALVGDLANGRTVRSLAYLLSMYPGVKMYFVAPQVVAMKQDIKDYLDRCVVLLQSKPTSLNPFRTDRRTCRKLSVTSVTKTYPSSWTP